MLGPRPTLALFPNRGDVGDWRRAEPRHVIVDHSNVAMQLPVRLARFWGPTRDEQPLGHRTRR